MKLSDIQIAGGFYLIAAIAFGGIWLLLFFVSPHSSTSGTLRLFFSPSYSDQYFFIMLALAVILPLIFAAGLLLGRIKSRSQLLSVLAVGSGAVLAATCVFNLRQAFFLAAPLWWVFRAYKAAQPVAQKGRAEDSARFS